MVENTKRSYLTQAVRATAVLYAPRKDEVQPTDLTDDVF